MIRMEAKQAKMFSRWQDAIAAVLVAQGDSEMVADCRLDTFGQTALQDQFFAGVSAEDMAKVLPAVLGE